MTNNRQFIDNQQYNEQYQNHDYNNYNNNIPHGTGRFMTAEECEAIREAYTDNIGPLTGAVARMIERAFDHGLTAAEIQMAIEETGFAPRPSPYYLKAILENWVETGVTISKIRHEVASNQGSKWWKG